MQAYGSEINKEVIDLFSKYSEDPSRKLGICNYPLSTRFDTDSYVLGFDSKDSA